jgi:hypothetical protein
MILVAIVGIAGLLIAAYQLAKRSAGGAWQSYVAELKVRGDSPDPASVVPPAVPDAENMGMAPIFAPLFDYTVTGSFFAPDITWHDPAGRATLQAIKFAPSEPRPMLVWSWMLGRPLDLSPWQKYYRAVPDFPKSAASVSAEADVLTALTKFDDLYTQVRAACALPQCRFPIDYEPKSLLYPTAHYGVLSQFETIAALRACAELRLGKTDAAFEDSKVVMRLASAVEVEPLLLSLQYQEQAIFAALQPICEGLGNRQWNDAQLEAFESSLSRINFAARYQLVVRGERNLTQFPVFDELRRLPRKRLRSLKDFDVGGSIPAWVLAIGLEYGPTEWIDQNKALLGRDFDRFGDCVDPVGRRFFAERIEKVTDEENVKFDGNQAPWSYLATYRFPLRPDANRAAHTQGMTGLARIAIALERHRLKHGSYPKALEAIDHGLLPVGLPMDPATGRPPHYKLDSENTFTLYYDGWNRVDDGGLTVWWDEKKARSNIDRGDWVWPSPDRTTNPK